MGHFNENMLIYERVKFPDTHVCNSQRIQLEPRAAI